MIVTVAAECGGRSGLGSVPVRPAPTVGWASAILQTGRAARVLPVRWELWGGVVCPRCPVSRRAVGQPVC